MKTYEVKYTKQVTQSATIEIDATDEEEAINLANAQLSSLEWEEDPDATEHIDIDVYEKVE